MKSIFVFLIVLLMVQYSCKQAGHKSSSELITNPQDQAAIFKVLTSIDTNLASLLQQRDTLALLFLPIQAACPSCRNKIIDSIIKHKQTLSNDRLIVISFRGGKKTLNSYFADRGSVMPASNQIVIDSTNKAFEKELFYDMPIIYLIQNNRVYKRVSILPATVKEELAWFF